VKHAIETAGPFGGRRHFVGQVLVSDACLGANDPLGDGGGLAEIGGGDLFGRQAAHFTQGERDLRIGRQYRMAAGEDQSQRVVFDDFAIGWHLILLDFELAAQLRREQLEAARFAQAVDGPEAAGRDEPGAWIGGHARFGPLPRRGEEGVGQRFLGEFEPAKEADQACQHPAALGAIDAVEIGHGGVGNW
jgi:hypothetical protein